MSRPIHPVYLDDGDAIPAADLLVHSYLATNRERAEALLRAGVVSWNLNTLDATSKIGRTDFLYGRGYGILRVARRAGAAQWTQCRLGALSQAHAK